MCLSFIILLAYLFFTFGQECDDKQSKLLCNNVTRAREYNVFAFNMVCFLRIGSDVSYNMPIM